MYYYRLRKDQTSLIPVGTKHCLVIIISSLAAFL